MLTDYHCHILPGIDDGSKNSEMSLEMLELLKTQQVERVVFTPHFYPHREKSVENFLEKRRKAFESLPAEKLPIKDFYFGAEVAIERGLSELEGVEKLAVEGTDIILLELPYMPYEDWISEEIHNISCGTRCTIIIAHIHRYLQFYSKQEMENMLKTDAVFQVNNEAFGHYRERKFVKKLIKQGYKIIFGSDAHNMTTRRPDFDILLDKADRDVIDSSNRLLDEHIYAASL